MISKSHWGGDGVLVQESIITCKSSEITKYKHCPWIKVCIVGCKYQRKFMGRYEARAEPYGASFCCKAVSYGYWQDNEEFKPKPFALTIERWLLLCEGRMDKKGRSQGARWCLQFGAERTVCWLKWCVSHFSVAVVKTPSPRQQIGGRIVWSEGSSGISICHVGKTQQQSAAMATAAGRWVLTS